jgi:hypothetical protein
VPPAVLRLPATIRLNTRKCLCNNHLFQFAGVAELADAPDSKSRQNG